MQRQVVFLLLLGMFFFGRAHAGGWQTMEFSVEGVKCTAFIHVPASATNNSTPVVFVFHGHGGNARQVARSYAMEQQWSAAICVYMQGLNTPGQITDPQGKQPGWQALVGDQGDRDLKFFDAVLARLKQDYRVDAQRIYATGHSNGGGFTYLLWLARGEVFAAVAPSAAAAIFANRLAPKPALILGGKDDPLVKFAWQKRTMDVVKKINGCSAKGEPWGKQCTIYPSANGTPLATFIYPGGHQFNAEAPALITQFFKEHPGAIKK